MTTPEVEAKRQRDLAHFQDMLRDWEAMSKRPKLPKWKVDFYQNEIAYCKREIERLQKGSTDADTA